VITHEELIAAGFDPDSYRDFYYRDGLRFERFSGLLSTQVLSVAELLRYIPKEEITVEKLVAAGWKQQNVFLSWFKYGDFEYDTDDGELRCTLDRARIGFFNSFQELQRKVTEVA